MVIIECDRCGKHYENNKATFRSCRINGCALRLENGTYQGYKDLCDDCLESLEKWLSGQYGIVADPSKLTPEEIEEISKQFTPKITKIENDNILTQEDIERGRARLEDRISGRYENE